MNLEPRTFPARARAAVQVLIRWIFHRTRAPTTGYTYMNYRSIDSARKLTQDREQSDVKLTIPARVN